MGRGIQYRLSFPFLGFRVSRNNRPNCVGSSAHWQPVTSLPSTVTCAYEMLVSISVWALRPTSRSCLPLSVTLGTQFRPGSSATASMVTILAWPRDTTACEMTAPDQSRRTTASCNTPTPQSVTALFTSPHAGPNST